MSREVKFRVWDKSNKRMDEIDGIDLYLADNKIYEVCDRSYAYSNYMDKKDVTEQYELMQYTGLKDMNGEHIFEGDILVYLGLTLSYPYTVVEWNNESLRYNMWGIVGVPSAEWVKDKVVVGNIYETPELLQGG